MTLPGLHHLTWTYITSQYRHILLRSTVLHISVDKLAGSHFDLLTFYILILTVLSVQCTEEDVTFNINIYTTSHASTLHCNTGAHYYAALLPRRGPHYASHSVCPSVCLSVPLSLPSVTSRHLANYNDTRVLFGTRWGPHIVRPSRPHKLVIMNIRSVSHLL